MDLSYYVVKPRYRVVTIMSRNDERNSSLNIAAIVKRDTDDKSVAVDATSSHNAIFPLEAQVGGKGMREATAVLVGLVTGVREHLVAFGEKERQK